MTILFSQCHSMLLYMSGGIVVNHSMPLSTATNVGINCNPPGHQVCSCFVEEAKPPKEPPPNFFACQVISDEEADNMELKEENESIASTTVLTNFKRGGPLLIHMPGPTVGQPISWIQF